MLKNLLIVGSVSAQQLLLLNSDQHHALLTLQNLLATNEKAMTAGFGAYTKTPIDETDPKQEITPYVPPVIEGMTPIEMYKESLAWVEQVIVDTVDFQDIITAADAFITKNTAAFAEYGEFSLAKAYQAMSLVTVDFRNTLRDL